MNFAELVKMCYYEKLFIWLLANNNFPHSIVL